MVLLAALLGEDMAMVFAEVADGMEQNLVRYFRPHLHPEDAASLDDAVNAQDPEVCLNLVRRYGLRYMVDTMPHRWAVDDPWHGARPRQGGRKPKLAP
jgi:hypothetical protein